MDGLYSSLAGRPTRAGQSDRPSTSRQSGPAGAKRRSMVSSSYGTV